MTNFTTPPGRLVGGSLYRPRTTDANNKPKTDRNGQPRVEYFIPVAIPKQGEQHWSQTEWGALIWQEGHTAFPGIAQNPAFSWKITDGDDQTPNKKGVAPCTREGYPGHWIINFSSSFAVKIVDRTGHTPLLEQDAVVPGYWVQVAGNVVGNKNPEYPGVYVNPEIVSLQGYAEAINVAGQDPTQAGFGQAALPAGVSQNPVGGMPAGAPPAANPQAAPAPAANPQAAPAPQYAPAPAANPQAAPAPQYAPAPAANPQAAPAPAANPNAAPLPNAGAPQFYQTP